MIPKKRGINSVHHMNPVGFYLTTNKQLALNLNNYFKYIDYIEDKKLKEIIVNIKDNATAMEKIQAISLLSAIKFFYIS